MSLKAAGRAPENIRPSTFWIGTAALALVAAAGYRDATASDVAGFLVLAFTALLPFGLWCHRRTHGLPLYPIFAAGTVPTFALPLISDHPLVIDHSPQERFLAVIAIAAANIAGTIPWYLLTRRPPPLRRSCYEMRRMCGDLVFGAILLFAIAFNLAQIRLVDSLDAPVLSIIRAVVIALSNIAIYLLAHRWGRRKLSPLRRAFCAVLFVGVMVSTLPSALMVGALSYGLMALIGFALGRGRLPWLSLAALAAAALFLQGGKEELRDKYWYGAEAGPVGIGDAPAFLADWVRFSFEKLGDDSTTAAQTATAVSEGESQSLLQRASLLQLFLRIQQMSPDPVAYLHGRTYAIIPGLLVPRVFDPQKARAHLGTYMLAIHYDLQTHDDTLTTTIGFGLINEAMANFGYPGCVAIALALGLFYGAVARWSAGYPPLSLRQLFAVLVLSVSFQNEFSASVYVTTLFQGSCALLLFAVPAMRCARTLPRALPSALAGAPA
jgi:hypothetical protein